MRYRPFGHVGQSSSALTLDLSAGLQPRAVEGLVCAALENGINSYLIALGDVVAAGALHVAHASVGRRALLVTAKAAAGVDPAELRLRETLAAGGLGYLDALLLDLTGDGAMSDAQLQALGELRKGPLLARLGVWGGGDVIDAQLRRFDFDVLATRYNLRSGWRERNRIKAATERGMAILAFGHQIDAARAEPSPKGLRRFFGRSKPPEARAYDFLHHTPGWTPDQIGLAFALTEPALASVVIEPTDRQQLEASAAAVERELPVAATAQIEIARFAA